MIEKQRTTPDVYPLSLNALRLACNQSTNREPVVDYDEPAIRDALQRLSAKGWVRLASGPSSRAVKYRHLFDEALGLSGPEISLLTVLMLRGAQTVGELKSRTERLHRFDSLAEVDETLHALAGRELVVRLERRPGQKEERWEHRLGEPEPAATELPTATLSRSASAGSSSSSRSCESSSSALAVIVIPPRAFCSSVHGHTARVDPKRLRNVVADLHGEAPRRMRPRFGTSPGRA